MQIAKMIVNASDNLESVLIPKEYRGRDIIVTFAEYTPNSRQRPNPRRLFEGIADSGKSLDDYRRERLMKE